MEPTQELIDTIYIEKVRRARKIPMGLRATMGIQMFEELAEFTKSMIRHQNPSAEEAEVEQIFRARLKKLKAIREHGLYVRADSASD